MKYKVEIHSDHLGLRISKRLNDDWQQIIFSIRPWVIWTRKGSWGKAKPGRKERKTRRYGSVSTVVRQTGPWESRPAKALDRDGSVEVDAW